MKWLRGMMLGALVLGAGAGVGAQEPGRAVIRLGTPTPLADSAGVVSAFVPLPAPAAPSAALQRASYVQPWPAPTVVRGAAAVFDDEPKQPFVPGVLPPLGDAKPILPTVPPPVKKIDTAPPPSAAPIIAIGTDGSLTVIADSARDGTPKGAQALSGLQATGGQAPLGGPAPFAVYDEAPLMRFDGYPGQAERFYARAEWLQWWTSGFRLPPLVLTASPDTPLATRGILGVDPTARIIYGNNDTSSGPSPGARFTFGYNLDPCGWCTFEASFFFLGDKFDNAGFNSTNFPVLGRPFYDLNDQVPNRELTTSPLGSGLFAATGSIRVDTSSSLLGAEANLRSLLWCGCNWKVTGLIGFRYLDLSEQLGITEQATALTPIPLTAPDVPIRVGDQITVFDRFNTENRFYGGQIGAAGEWQRDRWSLEAGLKLAVGATEQTVDINGGQRIVSLDGRTQSFLGGLYAVPSNIGNHSQARVAFVPELNLKLGYDLTDHVRLFVGYDLLYWSSVLRPGDQIDQVLDLNQVPNSGRPYPPASQVRPVAPLQTSSFWAQGFNAGILIRY